MPCTQSPLRYPGGKTQLAKFVNTTIKNNNILNPIYCEPYAGGAGVAIQLLLNNDVDEIIINDYDPAIFSFWNACVNNSVELIQLIEETPVSLDEWYRQKDLYKQYGRDVHSLQGAFSTLYLNRTNVSGIISGGPIGGKTQNSKYKIDCRFNKTTLINKIRKIAHERNRIHLYNEDATNLIEILKNNYPREQLFTFFDPPYYCQGKSLYLSFYNHDQHEQIRNKILDMDNYYWILTYDKAPQISEMYSSAAQSYEYSLRYSANQKVQAKEFLFASPLTHLQSCNKVELIEI